MSDLDKMMEQRRIELRMTWGQVAKRSGITRAGLGAIRRGERRPMALTCARIEDALQWAPGSVNAILHADNKETVELQAAVGEVIAARAGDSNDHEFDVLTNALSLALARWPEIDQEEL